MVEQNVRIKNETGLHARPAASLVQLVKDMDGRVELVKDGKVANAKSIFSVMALGISQDTDITVRLDGEDEEENLQKIVEFVNSLNE